MVRVYRRLQACADPFAITQMYKVEPLAGSYEPVVNTKMHSVPSMTS